MYRENKQTTIFADPTKFMDAKLNPKNRWVMIAGMVPWDMIEKRYAENFKVKGKGRPAKPARFALASHLVKEKYGLSDEETVEMIRENPYIQFLMGYESFVDKRPFDASTMVWFRKRMTPEMVADVNEYIIAADQREAEDDGASESDDGNETDKDDDDASNDGGGDDDDNDTEEEKPADAECNKGTIILDATCCPVDMRFPTDVSLLNEGRERLERMISHQHKTLGKPGPKPRTYCKVAKKEYLRFARSRKRTVKTIRTQIRKQLNYVKRDTGYVKRLGKDLLTEKERGMLAVIETLYAQQKEMYDERKHSVPDRVVSIWRPYVRPIKRGKETADTEFGPKVTISMVDGDARVERFLWDNYNETATLIESVERFHERTGHYPERVLADKIFRTRDNLMYCKLNGIRLNGPALGRPPKDKVLYHEQCLLERAEAGERNAVEGEFGVSKRRYSLGLIMMRLKENCELQVHMTFLSMNIWRRVRCSLLLFFAFSKNVIFSDFLVSRHCQTSKRRDQAFAACY